MIAWWNGISLRERAIVVVAAVIGLYIFVDLAIIGPFFGEDSELEQQVEQAREDLDWMVQAIPRVSVSAGRKQPLSGSIVSFVDAQVSNLKLKEKLQQMTPLQDGQVRIRINDVNFEQLLRFFAVVDRSVTIHEVRILPQSEGGVVDASAILKQPG